MSSDGAPKSNDGLRPRVASAAVLIPATLGAVYVGGTVFAVVVGVLALVMAYEWSRMIEGRDLGPSFLATTAFAVPAMALATCGQYALAFALTALSAASACLFVKNIGAKKWAVIGAIYTLAPPAALIWLRNGAENGFELTLLLFLIVWAADTGGYAAGRIVGGPKMSPTVSPAKTWAGAVGGLLLGAFAGCAGAFLIGWGDRALLFLFAGAALGVASILGDMAESAVKRKFDLKDTSRLIPGHGGALDRLDGMIFATTALTLVLYFHALLGRLEG